MNKNLGNADRVIRLAVAAVVFVLFFTNIISGVVGYVLLAAAVIFALTSFMSFCPIYAALGINSLFKKKTS